MKKISIKLPSAKILSGNLRNKLPIGLIILFGSLSMLMSCKKYLDIDLPKTTLTTGTVFTDAKTANAAVLGIYSSMMQLRSLASSYPTLQTALYTDELLTPTSPTHVFTSNNLLVDNSDINSMWGQGYSYIYSANAILNGLENAGPAIDTATAKQLKGEALFVRAFSHFYLANMFGDVPLITTTNYLVTDTIARTPTAKIYSQIISDLKSAQGLLSPGFYGSSERIRPNKWAAAALLARVYLYTKDYASAEATATTVINSGIATLQSDLTRVFLKNSAEAIWQMAPVTATINTWDGFNLVPSSAVITPNYALTSSLQSAFEAGDKRFVNWTGKNVVNGNTFYYPAKYKQRTGATVTEYTTVFRIAEQYLIRAEARAQQVGKLPSALADLNIIRNRAGLGNSLATDQAGTLAAIYQEDRVEFFVEYGHRFFDLKRTGRIDVVLTPVKPNWKTTSDLFPIPISQINANPYLKQNPGY